MKRCWKFSEFTQSEFFTQKFRGKTTSISLKTEKKDRKKSTTVPVICEYVGQTPLNDSSKKPWSIIIPIFSDKGSCNYAKKDTYEYMCKQVSELLQAILRHNDDAGEMEKVLDDKGVPLFREFSDGSAVIQLLKQLKDDPVLALEIFEWRRKQFDNSSPMTSEEYAKGITLAGRLKNVVLAVDLFKEAANKQMSSTSVCNALLSTYMYNGSALKCNSWFREMKMNSLCTPSIVTYNILISAFGRLALVDHMEATYREIKDLNLTPTILTYKNLIAGYITAWMWDKMEETYQLMKTGPVQPNLDVSLLMIRGYAISGKLEQMEKMYDKVRDHVDIKEFSLIRVMISAYCKSSDVSRVEKIEELHNLIPRNEYRPWLNIKLICLYANQDLFEQMEDKINEAFEQKAYVAGVGTMKCIISSYFRQNAVDKLTEFLARAEHAGWRICKSLYHCRMVMYSSQMRLSEMERVLSEMDKINMHLSKKTFWILFKAYQKYDHRSKLEQVVGMMCKHGYGVPLIA